MGILAARDTLLRRIKGASLPEVGKVRVLGVDDFAFKKGSTYGTILLNLERRKVVDLLPERSQEGLLAWFRSHPEAGVEVATRDRSNTYREGLAKGAPGATHVADRWHLLHNLALTLEEYLLREKRSILQKAAASEAAPEEKDDAEDFGSGPIMPNRPRNHDRKIEEAARKRHERLVEQWRNIRRLYLAKADLRDICRQLGISARTGYRYKNLTEPPPRPAYKRKASVLDPYVPYLVARWREGCHNGKRLYREIREQGYRNSEEICARFTAQLRRAEAQGKPISSVPRARAGSVAGLSPTAKNVAALFMRHQEKLDEEQGAYLERLCEADEALADTRRLTQEFAEMARRLEGEDLDGWLMDAEESTSTAMRSFALGLRKDLDAVRAGLTQEWSNGCVEGFIHKLKLLTGQGYGRAGAMSCSERGCWQPENGCATLCREGRSVSPLTRQNPTAQRMTAAGLGMKADHRLQDEVRRPPDPVSDRGRCCRMSRVDALPTPATFLAFGLVALGMVCSPGPNMIYLVSRSIAQGRKAGMVSLLGVAAGFFGYLLLTCLGLAAVFEVVPAAYVALKWAGAAYLLWLAWQAIRPGADALFEPKELPPDAPRRLFAMGLLTNLLNPKIAVLYVSLLPQFVDPERGAVLGQSLALGLTQIAVSLAVNAGFVLGAGSLALWLARRPIWLRLQRWFMATVLGLLALRLVTERARP